MMLCDKYEIQHTIGVKMHGIMHHIIFHPEPLKYFESYCMNPTQPVDLFLCLEKLCCNVRTVYSI